METFAKCYELMMAFDLKTYTHSSELNPNNKLECDTVPRSTYHHLPHSLVSLQYQTQTSLSDYLGGPRSWGPTLLGAHAHLQTPGHQSLR